MENIIIYGASGHGSVVLDCLEKEGKYNVIGFLDSFKKKGSKHCGYNVLGNEYDIPYLMDKYNMVGGIVAIGDNWIRKTIVNRILATTKEFDFVSAIHPSAIIGKDVHIGRGVAILPGVIINTNSSVHDHCILNTNSSLDHDGIMFEYSSLAPNVCVGGNCRLGKFSSICLGAHVIESIKINQHTVIGAGSLVLRNIEAYVLAYGSPARVIRKRIAGDPYLALDSNKIKSVEPSIVGNFN